MPRSLHVRLDETAEAALNAVRAADGGTDSDVVRAALRESAERRRRRAALSAEVQALMSDEDDGAEMRAIREQMASLAPDVSG